jgi:hypothetical protein
MMMMMIEMFYVMVVYKHYLFRRIIKIDNSYSIFWQRLFSDEHDDDDDFL